MALPSLIAFGALAPWPAADRLDQLRNALQHEDSLKPIVNAIQELPLLWKDLSNQDTILHSIAGAAAADQLAQWISGAGTTPIVNDQGNVTKMPMTTITHIVQYISYLHQCDGPLRHQSIKESVAVGGGIQGFCIGLLSALAVASGKTEDDVGHFAAISVRLAFCIGAYVDLDQHRSGAGSKTSSLATRWKAPTTMEDIQRLLSRHPDTYVAVVRDVRNATITVPASVMEHLLDELSREGASVLDTGVSGRYHAAIHKGNPQKILKACQAHYSPTLDGQSLVRSNTDAHLFSDEDIALSALECILGERADWYSTISAAASALNQVSADPFILSIGVDAVPQSVARSFPVVKAAMVADRVSVILEPEIPALASDPVASVADGYPEDAIAIIGMGCRFPGADSIDEFWSLLTEGKSMLSEIPEWRFGRDRPTRSKSGQRFWGNFLRDIDAFDHGFFKKAPREAVSMDPQQRVLLQVAYEALESSGYFSDSSRPEDVGCYIGACATDYDFNVASHPPTAYSAIGTLRSFLSGKLSHYFGWSGPSLVLDTACSSSAVAIHTACTALRTGQCSQALAGGITLMTSPYLYENFAAAHFLSPTGGSKPFSADADGYGRGEGGGLVVLKRLSDALRDNEQILGVIAGSAVNQNDNCVPITVPHTSSQGNLYERVTKEAGLIPGKVDFVEAHGTGTPVGDPIEMESIRRVFGGSNRGAPLIVSSAKGNIGHLEGASGVAALIKVLLQMENRLAPRQASFKTLNPRIPALEPDNVCIPTSNLTLPKERLAACVNNYGAAGSNAAMIILEAPCNGVSNSDTKISSRPNRYPIQLAAASVKSLLAYCTTLDKFCHQLRRTQSPSETSQVLSNLAFSLAKRLNHGLPFRLTTTATDLDQLQTQLRQQSATNNAIKQRSKASPVVLCFGGQVSDRVALDKRLWQESTLLRSHLDICDSTLRTIGYPGLYPGIFQNETVTDVVALHSMIFATQYSCAQTWLESGLKVDALVGHSFGQLTAMCVSGILSLRDGLELVAGRASLMQKHWGPESGTMIAVETDQQTLKDLQTTVSAFNASYNFEIACFNGPTSHVVVSDKASADELEVKLTERAIRYKRLSVPYGFHSRFTEPLLSHLESLASSLAFHEPKIPLETCSDTSSWTEPTAKLITAHTREPVFFAQAVERLQAKLGPCTWVEAGSDSSIVSMVRRAIGQSSAAANNFVSLQLNKPNSTELVVDATVTLWNASHRVQYWNFHKSQRPQYDRLRLPPYAWENSKHWLQLDMSAALNSGNKSNVPPPTNETAKVELPPVLIRLESSDSRGHHFVMNPSSEEYQTIVKDVESLGSAVCPSTLYVELASRAVRMADEVTRNGLLSVKDFQVHSLLVLNVHHTLCLDLQRLDQGWRFRVTSADGSSNSTSPGEPICHAEGIVNLKAEDGSLEEEFRRWKRLTAHDKVASIADDPRNESLRGNVIYKMLARAVNYPNWYHGVKSMAAVGSRVVAKVTTPAGIPEIVSKEGTTQLPILESFIQVASLHANCLHECFDGDVILRFTGVDDLKWAPGFESHGRGDSAEASWDVVAYTSTNAGQVTYDMFIHDAATAQLVVIILGVQFADHRRPVTTAAGSYTALAPVQDVPTLTQANVEKTQASLTRQSPPAVLQPQAKMKKPGKDAKTSIYEDICVLLETLADIPRDQTSGDATFESLEVDSLMIIEVISELSTMFRVELPIDQMVDLTDIDSLVDFLHKKGCVGSSFEKDSDNASSSSSSEPSSTEASSPPESLEGSATITPPELADDPSTVSAKPASGPVPTIPNEIGMQPLEMGRHGIQQVFERLRFDFEKYAEQTGAKAFWTDVYPQQADLVCAYVVDGLRNLDCDIASLATGQELPSINALPRHKQLVAQLRNILVDSGLLELRNNEVHARTAKTLDSTPTATRYEQMLQRYPLYASETKLLDVTGPRLAECLLGKKEPLSLLFGNKHNLGLLADFYAESPLCKTATRLLAEFVSATFSAKQSEGTLCILEVGAGTGGTTKYLVDFLTSCGVSFEYTFTDISQSLVSQAKKKFSSFPQMKYTTLDCDRPAPQELLQKFHIVISTNCIHATSNITTSATNILPTLRDDGVLCLVEFTRNLYWFDLVFGLLEGWWLFSDGRQHALASEQFWDSSLRAAGFKHVTWTAGNTEEANTLRLISAFKAETKEDRQSAPRSGAITKRAGVPMEEVVWKRVDALELSADVYFPKTPDPPGKKRPIALLIHGGGHFLFGRKDVPMKHIRTLIERGFLPVSTDYRLCPETNLFEGPMTDCCDALKWATETLPTLSLLGPTVRPDPTKVVSFGWSSGGQLAMSLCYAAPARGIKAPDAIFGLYPPSDMECDHWDKPCFPLAAEEEPTDVLDILAGVRDSPIVEYAPVSEKRTMALSLTLKDDRAKIILHMCWNSQTVPILVNGLPHKSSLSATDKTDWRYRPAASAQQVQAISPLWQIRQGNYKTPTFIVHGNGDDWLPLSMSERTIKELKDRGVPAELVIPERCGHAFDLFPVGDPLGVGWTAIEQGYSFICSQLGMN